MSNPTLNPNVLEFVVFCIENVAETLGVNGERVFNAFTEKAIFCMDILYRNMTCFTPRAGNISFRSFWMS